MCVDRRLPAHRTEHAQEDSRDIAARGVDGPGGTVHIHSRHWRGGIVKTFAVCSDAAMSQPSTRPTLYKGYRFPPEIISHCVWLYYRFGVSLRDVSELMLARGIEVSHEAIRLWTLRFGAEYARRLRRTRGACSNIWHLDELCLMING